MMLPEANDPVIADFETYRRRARTRNALPPSGGGTGGGDLDNRVAALERSFGKIDGKLDEIIEAQTETRLSHEQRFGSIAERLARIETKLDTKASATDVSRIDAKLETTASATDLAEIKGRVTALPTTWQMITPVIGTVFTILGGSFLILKLGLPHGP